MYKLAYNNPLIPIILLIVSLGLSIITAFLAIAPLPAMPVFLLLLSVAVFFGFSLIFYPTGGFGKFLTITAITLIIYGVTVGLTIAVVSVLGKPIVSEGMMLTISSLAILIPIVMSMAIVKTFIRLQKLEAVSQVNREPEPPKVVAVPEEPLPVGEPSPEQVHHFQSEQQIIESQKQEMSVEPQPADKGESLIPPISAQTEEIFFEDIMEETTPQEVLAPEPAPVEESEPEIFFEDIIEEPATCEPLAEPQTSPVQQQQPETVFEITVEPVKDTYEEPIVEVTEPEQPVTQQPEKQAEPPVSIIDDGLLLGDLPQLEGDIVDFGALEAGQTTAPKEIETVSAKVKEETKHSAEVDIKTEADKEKQQKKEVQQDMSEQKPPCPENKTPIPQLAENPKVKTADTGGKITSIGKLLVDHRDIENIIETNALMQGISVDATTTQIISAVAGGKTNEKLALLAELGGVQNSLIVDQAGFIRASTMKDLHKEQVIGALASGSFGILSASLKRIGFQPAKDVSVEASSSSIILNRVSNDIIAVFVNPDVHLYSMDEISNILPTAAERDTNELMVVIGAINGVIGVILASSEGELIANKLIDNSKNACDIANMLPAFYTNLNVFAKNMEQGSVRKVIINTGNEMLLLTSIGSSILLLYATPNTAILPSEKKLQYEAIIG